MSSPHHLHADDDTAKKPPDAPADDSDSDLEIDLHELDPHTSDPPTAAAPYQRQRRERDPQRHREPAIALRKLRMGGLRRYGLRNRGYGELGHGRDGSLPGDDHDHDGGGGRPEALLADRDDEGAARYSEGSAAAAGDDAPLLSAEHGQHGSRVQRRRRRRPSAGDRLRSLASRLRLPSLVSGRRAASRRHDDDHDRDHDDDDHDDDHDDLDDRDDPSAARTVPVGASSRQAARRFPPNVVSNAKYTPLTFLPVTLYNEFSFFFNMYFLLVALSQALPPLRIGYLSTYVAPLAFVLLITLGKEAYDDLERRRRDNEANSEAYTVLQFGERGRGPVSSSSSSTRPPRKTLKSAAASQPRRRAPDRDRLSDIQEEEEQTESAGLWQQQQQQQQQRRPAHEVREVARKARDLQVGDVLKLTKGQRVPADVVILKCLSVEEEGEQESSGRDLPATAVFDPPQPEEPLLIDHAEPGAAPAAADPPAASEDEASATGETFIRTDQLDGETDWKLRLASPLSQQLPTDELVRLSVTAGKPDRKVNEFVGTLHLSSSASSPPASHDEAAAREGGHDDGPRSAPLSVDNTAWANTVIASHATTLAVVLYTGPQTRSALSTAPARSKTGLLEYEINALTKILCVLTLALSVLLVALEGFASTRGAVWYVKVMRFLVLFSTIVPISLRVNLDLGKSVYSWCIQRDPGMPGAVVRTSTIPEDLGRIEYLLSDKTGTLTQNDMEMRKIHIGTVSYAHDAMDEVAGYVRQGLPPPSECSGDDDDDDDVPLLTPSSAFAAAASTATRTRREIGTRVRDVVLALALCHNVTPTRERAADGRPVTAYQASSPDEIAILRWTESVGLRLAARDRRAMTLESPDTGRPVVQVRILDLFPFTSEGKRMGIVVQFCPRLRRRRGGPSRAGLVGLDDGEIWFYQKGADTVMGAIVAANDWLDEEAANMAREGLRTLVVGRRRLSPQQYAAFAARYREASLALQGRDAAMQAVVAQHLERDLELLGVTGVEDRLQRDVKPSLELLRNAGIKIWMLTGDKVETARCVAVSARLVARGQYIYTVARLRSAAEARDHLDFLRGKTDCCLLVDGESLQFYLSGGGGGGGGGGRGGRRRHHHGHDGHDQAEQQQLRADFVAVAVRLPAVVACRCSPTQKAEVARLIREHTRKRVCCIGDGGNDVSMIQAADVGVGIVGKEGRQASLAADFSIQQFCHLTKLLVWHGRNSYKRSAKLAQFVIHRGLIIAVCQTMYSIALHFEPEGLYKDWLLVGYATVYTAAPVLSLVLDKDVDENVANLYPELYKELTSGRSLSYRTFFVWVLVSVYQGGVIQGLSQLLTEVDSKRMVAVSFTVLVLNELLMVAIEITTWHWVMVVSILGTFLVFAGSFPFLGRYFDLEFVLTLGFLWRVAAIGAISLVPPYAGKLIRRTMNPPSYRKVQGI